MLPIEGKYGIKADPNFNNMVKIFGNHIFFDIFLGCSLHLNIRLNYPLKVG